MYEKKIEFRIKKREMTLKVGESLYLKNIREYEGFPEEKDLTFYRSLILLPNHVSQTETRQVACQSYY